MQALLPKAHRQRIPLIEFIGSGLVPQIFPLRLKGRPDLPECRRKGLVWNRFQLLHPMDSQLLHHHFPKPPSALGIGAYHAVLQHSAHIDSLGKQSVGPGGLQQGGDLCPSSGLAKQRHILRISPEPFDIVPYPPQGGNQVIRPRIPRIGILLPEIRQIKIAQQIQPMIHRDYYHLP